MNCDNQNETYVFSLKKIVSEDFMKQLTDDQETLLDADYNKLVRQVADDIRKNNK